MKLSAIIFLIRSMMTLGGEQEFLGARWISILLKVAPFRRLAERLLSFSPHYFYGKSFWLSRKEIRSEFVRNDNSRKVLMEDVLSPHLQCSMTVLDYGCGPGFLAKHVSTRVAKVYAVDVVDGVLACAKLINPGKHPIDYRNIKIGMPSSTCQLAFSFAVFQHLTRDACERAAEFISSSLSFGGVAIIHLVIDADGWESEYEIDSVMLKVKRKYGLNCFSRSRTEYVKLFQSHGFGNIQIQQAKVLTDVTDDIQGQHILTAVKIREERTI